MVLFQPTIFVSELPDSISVFRFHFFIRDVFIYENNEV